MFFHENRESKVLIVEDNDDMREVLESMVSSLGMKEAVPAMELRLGNA